MGSRRVLGSSRGSTTAGLEPDFGTGRAERERRQWRPLDQALAVLWQACAWRDLALGGDPLTAGSRDPGGVVAGDGVGGLRPARLVVKPLRRP